MTLDLWPPLVLRAPAEYTAPVEGPPPAVGDDGLIAVPETGVSFGRFFLKKMHYISSPNSKKASCIRSISKDQRRRRR